MTSELAVTIGFTDAFWSKDSRMLGPQEVKEICSTFLLEYPTRDELVCYRAGRYTSEFHLTIPEHNYVMVIEDQIDHFVVVAQTHIHTDYEDNVVTYYVDESTWSKRYGHRVPARGDGDIFEVVQPMWIDTAPRIPGWVHLGDEPTYEDQEPTDSGVSGAAESGHLAMTD